MKTLTLFFVSLTLAGCGGADIADIPCQSAANCPTVRPTCSPAGICVLPLSARHHDGGDLEVVQADVLRLEVAVDDTGGTEAAPPDTRVETPDARSSEAWLEVDAKIRPDARPLEPDASIPIDAFVPPPDTLACIPEPSICKDRGYTCGPATDACGTVYGCGSCGGGTPKCFAHACVCLTC